MAKRQSSPRPTREILLKEYEFSQATAESMEEPSGSRVLSLA